MIQYWNSGRLYLDRWVGQAAQSVPTGSLVLDAGAGGGLYKTYFSKHEYESADFCQVNKDYGEITYVCDLSAIPVEADRYDMVLMTQVLEHLAEPQKVLKEIYRILKPGAALWLSAPLYYEEHEQPHDYFRYTQFGFAHLLKQAGFEVESCEWLEGYFGTVAHQLKLASENLPRSPSAYGGGWRGLVVSANMVLLKPFLFVWACLFARLDLRKKWTLTGHCKNYCLVARKNLAGLPQHTPARQENEVSGLASRREVTAAP
jgi:SAM-dependent methyltransferase